MYKSLSEINNLQWIKRKFISIGNSRQLNYSNIYGDKKIPCKEEIVMLYCRLHKSLEEMSDKGSLRCEAVCERRRVKFIADSKWSLEPIVDNEWYILKTDVRNFSISIYLYSWGPIVMQFVERALQSGFVK